ncbi:hypothetical protein BH11PLA2_BH11PLA2_15240 [soil metagenome]
MKPLSALLALMLLTSLGCGRGSDKNINKDQDRPKASATK